VEIVFVGKGLENTSFLLFKKKSSGHVSVLQTCLVDALRKIWWEELAPDSVFSLKKYQ